MNRVYIYKTKDGQSFDLKNDAVRHERKAILQEIFSTVAMSAEERTRMIDNILDKFDVIVEAFEGAEVMDADADDE